MFVDNNTFEPKMRVTLEVPITPMMDAENMPEQDDADRIIGKTFRVAWEEARGKDQEKMSVYYVLVTDVTGEVIEKVLFRHEQTAVERHQEMLKKYNSTYYKVSRGELTV